MEDAMKIELRPTGQTWTWVVREGNVANVSGRRFSSLDEALRDAREGYEADPEPDDPPPLVA
jgi:hypothetical protein